MILQEGMNSLSVFGEEYSDDGIVRLHGDTLLLTLIIVKQEYRRKGALHRLIKLSQELASTVIIVEPSDVVLHTALQHGFIKGILKGHGIYDGFSALLWWRGNDLCL